MLHHAVAELRAAGRAEEVDLSSRDWAVLARDLADGYERAISLARSRA